MAYASITAVLIYLFIRSVRRKMNQIAMTAAVIWTLMTAAGVTNLAELGDKLGFTSYADFISSLDQIIENLMSSIL